MDLAYLDPGSGSMLVAAVVAGFSGAMVITKVWWRRVLSKLRRKPAAPVEAAAGPERDS